MLIEQAAYANRWRGVSPAAKAAPPIAICNALDKNAIAAVPQITRL